MKPTSCPALSRHGPDDLAAVAAALNSRPRKTLGGAPDLPDCGSL